MTTLTDSEIVGIRIWAWEQLEGWGTKIKSGDELAADNFRQYSLQERMDKANDLANWLMAPATTLRQVKEDGTEITFSQDEVTDGVDPH
jgi:hypothetical protein